MKRLLILSTLLFMFHCPSGTQESPDITVHEGVLAGVRGRDFTYVRGDVIDVKGVSIDYLEGDIRGKKNRTLWINVMRGVVTRGPATINVLHGDIIEGDGVTVNLLIGEDFSGQAKIGKQVDPEIRAAVRP